MIWNIPTIAKPSLNSLQEMPELSLRILQKKKKEEEEKKKPLMFQETLDLSPRSLWKKPWMVWGGKHEVSPQI
jgi:hypothetical protein